MSAICGVVRFDGNDVAAGMAGRMARAMKHRGADAIESIDLGRLALGHCLLRVNREDLYEMQPIVERDAVLVADLRLDNREELAATLGIAATDLATMPDSVVLLHAWRHWGDACAAHLLGDFAFAIWDRATGSLLLARDHMGQRVLLYHFGEGFLAFATELPGLFVAEGVPRRIDEDELARRLLMSQQWVEGQLLYDGIRILPGGMTLRLDAQNQVTTARYWAPQPAPVHAGRDEAYFIETYRATVEEAVACRVRRLICPPTLLFSGGFDSGVIAAIVGPMLAAKGQQLTCAASVLAEGDPRSNARPAVEAFRGMPGLDIHFYVRGDETAYDALEEGFAATGRWHAPNLARRSIADIAHRAGSRLAIDGHGGDYTVHAYDPAMLGGILRDGELRRFAREFRARMRFTGWSPWRVFGRDVLGAIVPSATRRLWRRAVNGFVPAWRRRGLAPGFVREKLASGAVDRAKIRDGFPVGPRGAGRWCQILDRVSADSAGSSYGEGVADLDLARPFHDKRIVELALALPDSLRFRDGRERWLPRTVFADILPAPLIDRMPGNHREQPDMLAMNMQAAPAMIAAVRAVAERDSVTRYIDVEALEKLVADSASEERMSQRVRLNAAMRTLTAARFLAWLDRSNQ